MIFPELDALYGVPQPAQWHPEIDTGVHVMMALRLAARISASTAVRFAVLMHDLGKARTPQEKWPSHHGHEQRGVPADRSAVGAAEGAERLSRPRGAWSRAITRTCIARWS